MGPKWLEKVPGNANWNHFDAIFQPCLAKLHSFPVFKAIFSKKGKHDQGVDPKSSRLGS